MTMQIAHSPNRSVAVADPKCLYSVQNTITDWQQAMRIVKKRWPFIALFATAVFSAIAILILIIVMLIDLASERIRGGLIGRLSAR